MARLNRNLILVFMSAIFLTFATAAASPTLPTGKKSDPSPAKNDGPSLGTLLTRSSAIKVGQTQVYTGTEPSGKTIEVILTRTKKGLIALDGTCTAQGEKVVLKKTQLICLSQGSVFTTSTGDVVLGPNGSPKNSISPLSHYTITERSGNIYIK